MTTESLTNKTFNGAKWSLAGNIIAAFISFIAGVILARILTVEQYGFLGMITVFIAVSNAFIDSGFSNSLIRKKEVSVADYNTLFYFNVGVSVICFCILFLLAKPIADFYKMPLLVPVTRVVAITLIINAVGLVQSVVLTKQINFKVQAWVNMLSTSAGALCAILLAVRGFGVWSLVWQLVVKQSVNTLLIWILCPWRPNGIFSASGFSWRCCREMFGYGSKLLVAGLLGMMFDNAAYIIIGKFYTPKKLGYYTRGEQFTKFLSVNYTYAAQRATFPVLSMMQDDKARLKGAFIRVFRSIMLISVTLCMFLAAMAKPLVLSLLGVKWVESVQYLQLLCFIAMFFPLHAINLNIWEVKGRSDWILVAEFIKRGFQIIPVLIGIFVSIKYMLVAMIGVSIISLYVNNWGVNKLLGYSFYEEIKDIVPAFLLAVAVSSVIFCAQFLPVNCYMQFVIQLIGGTALFHFVYILIKQPQYLELKDLIMLRIKGRNNSSNFSVSPDNNDNGIENEKR